jgi:lipid-binding SYLF domain-containing protein
LKTDEKRKKIAFSILLASALTAVPLAAFAESLWDKTKSVAGGAVDAVEATAETVGGAVSSENVKRNQARAEIDSNAQAALSRLFKASSAAKKQFEASAGYAVFDTRKYSFLITTGKGPGVAVEKSSGKRTYMNMATGGLNIGGGVKFYQVIFLFPDQATLNAFVENGWSAGTDVGAQSGDEGANLGLQLKNGVIVHNLSDKGLVLAASLTGTKYWKDGDLN